MNNPESYRKAEFLKSDIKAFIDSYKSQMNWRSNGEDSLLDIGCAGGNITMDLFYEILPKTFSRLVGIDINKTMVDYARKNFKIPKVSFDVIDIGGDITEFLTRNEPFDHITSSLCLHLVPDQKQAFENIFKLLQPNGDCLLYILVKTPLFDTYRKMDKKWFKYMTDLDDYISPYYRCFNPEYLMSKYLKNAGFTKYEIKERTELVVYDDIKKFKDGCQSVISFFNRIPLPQQETFMKEYVELAKQLSENSSDGSIIFKYKLLTVFAQKN